jgi:tetratricopeptide (TPR) repeat protein
LVETPKNFGANRRPKQQFTNSRARKARLFCFSRFVIPSEVEESRSVLGSEVFIPSLSTERLKVVNHAEGGFGRVFFLQSTSGVKYALKTLKWEQGADRNDLYREALKLARIPRHPNIVEIIGVEWIKGDPYVVLPFCNGTLSDYLRGTKRLDPGVVNAMLLEISNGLDFLHREASLLHLDLKPSNVLLSEHGKCLLSDFGLAKYLPQPQPTGIHRDLFTSGIIGTVPYMSPEHFVSKKLIDKSDVFALGIIMFEMITGRHPFLKPTMEGTVRSILYDSPSFSWFQTRKFPTALKETCLRCLAKNPAHRPSAEDLVNQISGIEQPRAEIPPFDLPGTVNRATTLCELKYFKEARRLLEQCIAYNPWYLPARIGLAHLFFATNEIEKAIELSHQAIDIAAWCPEQSDSYVTLLVNQSLYYLTRDPEQSLKCSREAVRLAPMDWQAWGNIAEACRMLAKAYPERHSEKLAEGFAAIQRAFALNKDDLKLKITLGGLLLLKRDFARLSPLIAEIMNEAGGENIPARALLIETLLATGQLNEAKRWIDPMFQVKALLPLAQQYQRQLESRSREFGSTL